jgi:phosphomannomutase/phosphoglucomutase
VDLVTQEHTDPSDTHPDISPEINPAIFRAYDIRGIAGESLTTDTVYLIAKAIGNEAQARGQQHLVVGRDGRLSSPALFQSLCAGLLDSGCDITDIGLVATPVLYFAIHHLDIASGVMLTGSHNAADYNGLKILLDGVRLTADDIQGLYQRVIQPHDTTATTVSRSGTHTTTDVIPSYQQTIINDITLQRPLNIVFDCGNGVAGGIAPTLFRQLGCEVVELFCQVDGHFPHHHPDPTIVENLVDLQQAVRASHADIGLAFDGDADRVGVVTEAGDIVWPDRQMMLFAEDLLTRKPGASIVFDVKCSNHLGALIQQKGGKPELYKTGHSLIKQRMMDVGAPLGGEMSGHIFFAERWFGFDDGLYVGARLLEILAKTHQPISSLFAQYPPTLSTPELKIPVPESDKFTLMDALIKTAAFPSATINLIDGLRVEFTHGWGLIRPSNTSPYLTLRFEADHQTAMDAIQQDFRNLLLSVAPDLVLPF